MTVIPLIPQGVGRTVVENAGQFEEAGGLDGPAILIRDLDKQQLLSKVDANITYDLRVGAEYWDHRDISRTALPKGSKIKLHPGMAVVIRTEEHVRMPKSGFGVIVPKVSLLHKGISNTGSKIDPGYDGRLLITVFNLGKRTVTLARHEAFCSMYVLRVGDGARHYDKNQKELPEKPAGYFRGLRDWVEANHTLWLLVLTALTIIEFFRRVMSWLFDAQ